MHVAGIAIFKENEILLVHATNSSWKKSVLSIPKGHIERKEHAFDASRREVLEETGLKIKKALMSGIKAIPYGDGRMLYYYIVVIKEYSDLGMSSNKISKDNLQLKEVDWAGFVPIEKARKMMIKRQLPILDEYEKGNAKISIIESSDMKYIQPYEYLK